MLRLPHQIDRDSIRHDTAIAKLFQESCSVFMDWRKTILELFEWVYFTSTRFVALQIIIGHLSIYAYLQSFWPWCYFSPTAEGNVFFLFFLQYTARQAPVGRGPSLRWISSIICLHTGGAAGLPGCKQSFVQGADLQTEFNGPHCLNGGSLQWSSRQWDRLVFVMKMTELVVGVLPSLFSSARRREATRGGDCRDVGCVNWNKEDERPYSTGGVWEHLGIANGLIFKPTLTQTFVTLLFVRLRSVF